MSSLSPFGPAAAGVVAALAALADPERAKASARYFKTGPGEYGEGDRFLGVRVPQTRAVVASNHHVDDDAVRELLDSPWHEHRLAGLLIWVRQVSGPRTPLIRRAEVAAAYLQALSAGRVNNWDLIDSSAQQLLGEYWRRSPLDPVDPDPRPARLAASAELWTRRAGIVSTFAYLRAGAEPVEPGADEFDPRPLAAVGELVLADRRDLIQKAFGWMLREAGKRAPASGPYVDFLTDYLDAHAPEMGRTALSYATEHLTPEQRAAYRAAR